MGMLRHLSKAMPMVLAESIESKLVLDLREGLVFSRLEMYFFTWPRALAASLKFGGAIDAEVSFRAREGVGLSLPDFVLTVGLDLPVVAEVEGKEETEVGEENMLGGCLAPKGRSPVRLMGLSGRFSEQSISVANRSKQASAQRKQRRLK